MKRGGPIKRTKPVNPVNRKRKKKRAAEDRVYGSFFRYVCTLNCAVEGEGDLCFGPITGHHLKTVGSGGEDAANTTPLCYRHHRMIHDIGEAEFNRRFFNDLRLYAEAIWKRYCEGFDLTGEDL